LAAILTESKEGRHIYI